MMKKELTHFDVHLPEMKEIGSSVLSAFEQPNKRIQTNKRQTPWPLAQKRTNVIRDRRW
jgi:hypothetical protein